MSVSITRKRLFPGFDGKLCKVDPKLMTDGSRAILTWYDLLLSGSDVFYSCHSSVSRDGLVDFAAPRSFGRLERLEGSIRYNASTREVLYSRSHQKWLWFGSQLAYSDNTHPILLEGLPVSRPLFALIDPDSGLPAAAPQPIPFPLETISLLPFGQFIECENGELLLSFYFFTQERHFGSAVTARYALQDGALRLVEMGEPIYGDDYYSPGMRGLFEPSVAKLGSKYYITLRNDLGAYYAESCDGLHFDSPQHWRWDDGSLLESCNTMQRWVRFDSVLYLVYTRRDRLNGHVFRNRAPLYMTRFDTARSCLVRDEEIILVPELGARLGNFSVTDLSPSEAAVTVAEWMQPQGCEKYGADNSIWLVRVKKD